MTGTIPHIVTVEQAMVDLRALDPSTCIRENHLRNLIRRGSLPIIRVGRKQLINFGILVELLQQDGLDFSAPEPEGEPGIRPVKE